MDGWTDDMLLQCVLMVLKMLIYLKKKKPLSSFHLFCASFPTVLTSPPLMEEKCKIFVLHNKLCKYLFQQVMN